MHTTDYLLIGSGIAGLSLAIKLAERFPEKKITVCTKGKPSDGSTDFAQGGIAVVTDLEKDSFEKHIDDTLICGHHLSDPIVVEKVIKEAPNRYQDLVDWGFQTDFDENGNIKLGREGGHSEYRIIHYKDQTGNEIERSLLAYAKNIVNIELLSYYFAIDLIQHQEQCLGAIFSTSNQEVKAIYSSHTILATGGIGQVYGHTTNPSVSTGDGIAIANRVGVQIEDMEFVQFHPTAMYMPENRTTFLISEAVRGAGGILRNIKGEAFMLRYDKRGDLAPRDIVSQSIIAELKRTNAQHVYLDCTHLDKDELNAHFPMIKQKCAEQGIDIHTDMIPVAPAQHYLCGGIVVDINGQTNLSRLYASGECTKTGLHGANRLASNSLLEALIYSDSISKTIDNAEPTPQLESVHLEDYLHSDLPSVQASDIQSIRDEVNERMMENAGIIRENKKLQQTKNRLLELHEIILRQIATTHFDESTWEVRNIIEVALLIIQQSLERKESIGTFLKV